MKTRKHDFALGVTAIVFLALFLGTVVFLAPSLHARTRTIEVHFRHEDGLAPLKPGSLVLLSGAIEVGQVTSVEPREIVAESPRGTLRRTIIVVRADIDASLALYGNCEITTDMPLVGGTGTMVIANVGAPTVPLPRGPIDGLPPQGLAAFSTLSRRLTGEGGLIDRLDRMLDPEAEGSLLNKIMLSLADVNAMTMELRTQLSAQEQQTLLGKLHLVLDDLNATTKAIRAQMQGGDQASLVAKVHGALDVAHQDLAELLAVLTENRPTIRNTMVSIEHATRVIDEDVLARLKAEFDPNDAGSLLSQLHTGMDHLNTSLADLQVVTEAGKRLVVLNRPQIDRIVANAADMSAALSQTSKEIQLNPSRLIWSPPHAAEKKLDVFTAARDFAQAATYLDDAAARLQALIQAGPDGRQVPQSDEELQAMYDSLRGAFDRFQRAETFFWDQMK